MMTCFSRREFIQTTLTAAAAYSALPWASQAAAAGPVMKLAGFADEISPKMDEQIKVCKGLGVKFIELRAVEGKGVLDMPDSLQKEFLAKLKDNGMGIASIGSPIGKVKISDPWPAHFDKFKVAVERAEFFSAPLIRIFSFFPAKGEPYPQHRDEVMRRMQAMADYAKGHPVTLVHENEKDIYGEKVAGCVDIFKTVTSPKLRCAFDFANFLQAGEDPQTNWEQLKTYVAHIHIKDYNKATKKVVPAGQGDGHVQAILEDAAKMGYSGFLSLEPHLKVAGPSSGETGPELFKTAADALKEICRKAGITLA
jgi:sugar phosphate isomerase/epimerase